MKNSLQYQTGTVVYLEDIKEVWIMHNGEWEKYNAK